MSRIKDLTGQKFGLLTVLSRAENTPTGRVKWHCQCECGGTKIVASAELSKGSTRSCGCLGLAQRKAAGDSRKHKYSRSTCLSEYKTWWGMIARCTNVNHKSYQNYGGKGITVCERWRNSFPAFVDDMGKRPKGKTLDRIDSKKNYCPENCRWATRIEQANNRSDNHLIEYNGEVHTVMEWVRLLGLSQATVYDRIRKKLPDEFVLSPLPLRDLRALAN